MPAAKLTLATLIAAALALLPTAPAVAGSYYIVATTPSSLSIVDPAAVQRLDGRVVAPTITIQKSITAEGAPRSGYVRTVNEYDCAEQRSRWVRFTLYDRSGVALLTQRNEQIYRAAPKDGSDEARTLALLCGRGGREVSVVSAQSLGDLIITIFAGWDAQPPPAGAAGTR